MRLWIDTDLGDNPDDVVALALAVAHPGIELIGVSTVSGDVVARAEMVRRFFGDLGVEVPLVYAGPADPRALAAAEAVLAIGPLTNLAGLLRAGVDLPPTAVMGGVIRPTTHRGERRQLESNFAADPVAAAVVVDQAEDLLIVPLDVTAGFVADEVTHDRLASIGAVRAHLDRWSSADNELVLHDPLALLALVGECVTIGRRQLAVTVEGRLVEVVESGSEHDVVAHADLAAARSRVVDLVVGTPFG